MRFSETGSKQGGASLLEAMIGILIFSLGILALVGMQAIAIKQTTQAKYRVDASFLANQIIGEMWVNSSNLATYAYAGGGGPPAALANWVATVQNTLPGVTAAVNQPIVTVAGSAVTITVRWQPPAVATPNNYMTVAFITGS